MRRWRWTPGRVPRISSGRAGGDPDLRREVESLLARAADASDFLETTALELAGRALAAVPPALTVGRRFGQYEIRAFIGAGGMGEVYRAYDTRLERDVAIKCLPDSVTAVPSARARLEREARLLATLNHPNIGAIHGVVEADGVIGLILELVEGPRWPRHPARSGWPRPWRSPARLPTASRPRTPGASSTGI